MTLFIHWYCSCSQQFHGSVGWWGAVRTQCWVTSLWSCFPCVCAKISITVTCTGPVM